MDSVLGEQRVTELVREITHGDVAAADALPEALASLPPNEPTRAMLRRLLARDDLNDKRDSSGIPCRAALISAQLAQGYPYALEVTPDDLEWLRAVTSEREHAVDMTRAWTMGLALTSIGWNALWTTMAVPVRPLFAIAVLHAIAAFVVALRARASLPLRKRRRALTAYRILGAMGALGPIASVVVAHQQGDAVFLLGLIWAAPAMATAFACWPAGDRIVPEDQ